MRSRKAWILSVGRYILLGIIAVAGVTWVFGKLQWEWQKRHFVCSHPGYLRLSRGMTMAEVEEVLGKPTKVVHADDEAENFYCVGFNGPKPFYSQDTRCWYYHELDGWLGDILAYFDKNGILIGTGCGTG